MLHGVFCEFIPISEEQRLNDIEAAIKQGNHKSVTKNTNLLKSLVQDNIKAGFQVPIPINTTRLIVNRVLAPYGIAQQSSINKLGERIDKDRLTHN